MSFKNKDKGRPGQPKIEHIELSEKHLKLRWILVVACLAVACVAIMTGLFSMLNKEPGWQEVEASASGPNCSLDFQLHYDFSADGAGATASYRALSGLYTQAVEDGYRIFTQDLLEDGLYNLAYLNAHPNEAVSVDPALFRALEQIVEAGNRSIYLAPVYVEYQRIFLSENEEEAALYDPARNPELANDIRQMATFANDPAMIDLEIVGQDRVRLKVSGAYLTYAAENEITEFLDFSWMKNAFIIDYMAQLLKDNGFTNGYLASYDGFTRNLDERGTVYSFNVFDRLENAVYLPAQMQYDFPAAIVYLRNYPMSYADRWHYFSFSDGSIATMMIDSADGMSRSATDNLVCYSTGSGCAEMLLRMIPVYIAADFNTASLEELKTDGIYSIWSEDRSVCYNDPSLAIGLTGESDGQEYSLNLIS